MDPVARPIRPLHRLELQPIGRQVFQETAGLGRDIGKHLGQPLDSISCLGLEVAQLVLDDVHARFQRADPRLQLSELLLSFADGLEHCDGLCGRRREGGGQVGNLSTHRVSLGSHRRQLVWHVLLSILQALPHDAADLLHDPFRKDMVAQVTNDEGVNALDGLMEAVAAHRGAPVLAPAAPIDPNVLPALAGVAHLHRPAAHAAPPDAAQQVLVASALPGLGTPERLVALEALGHFRPDIVRHDSRRLVLNVLTLWPLEPDLGAPLIGLFSLIVRGGANVARVLQDAPHARRRPGACPALARPGGLDPLPVQRRGNRPKPHPLGVHLEHPAHNGRLVLLDLVLAKASFVLCNLVAERNTSRRPPLLGLVQQVLMGALADLLPLQFRSEVARSDQELVHGAGELNVLVGVVVDELGTVIDEVLDDHPGSVRVASQAAIVSNHDDIETPVLGRVEHLDKGRALLELRAGMVVIDEDHLLRDQPALGLAVRKRF